VHTGTRSSGLFRAMKFIKSTVCIAAAAGVAEAMSVDRKLGEVQCPTIYPQNVLDPAGASGEWFVQQASTTAFFDAVEDKCYTQFYLFDLDSFETVDNNTKTRSIFFNTYAEKKKLPSAEILQALKRFSAGYHRKLDTNKRELWGGYVPNPVKEARMVRDAEHGLIKYTDFFDGLFAALHGPGFGNFTMLPDGEVVRLDPLSQFSDLQKQIEEGFLSVNLCGEFKVASDFENILPCAAPAGSALARPDAAKWFYVFAGSIDPNTGYLVRGLVGDDLKYEYAIVTGGAQVPLDNGKCAPGAGFINGGYQLLSRFPNGEQKAIELLREFTEAHTNLDVNTLLPIKQAGCTYSKSKFNGRDPSSKNVKKFAQTLQSGNMKFACPKVKPIPKILPPATGRLEIPGSSPSAPIPPICVFVYLSTEFSGLNPKTDKCAQQGYFFTAADNDVTLTEQLTDFHLRKRKLGVDIGGGRPNVLVELASINNSTDVIEVDSAPLGTGFSLCGRVNSEATSYSLGSCFPDQTANSKPVGTLFTNWDILFLGVFIPGHMADGHFVKGRLANIADAAGAGFGFLAELGTIIVATGGQAMDPTPTGCNPGAEFIDSGLVISSTNPDGIPPVGLALIFDLLYEQGYNTEALEPVKQGVKNGCAVASGDPSDFIVEGPRPGVPDGEIVQPEPTMGAEGVPGKALCYLTTPNNPAFFEENALVTM